MGIGRVLCERTAALIVVPLCDGEDVHQTAAADAPLQSRCHFQIIHLQTQSCHLLGNGDVHVFLHSLHVGLV